MPPVLCTVVGCGLMVAAIWVPVLVAPALLLVMWGCLRQSALDAEIRDRRRR